MIALGAIWANKLRSFLTVLGNIVAVTSIIAVVSLVQGMNGYVTNAIVSGVGADNFTIQRDARRPHAGRRGARPQQPARSRSAKPTAVRKFSDNIGAVADSGQRAARLTYRNESIDGVQVQGVSRDYIYFCDVQRGARPADQPGEVDAHRSR